MVASSYSKGELGPEAIERLIQATPGKSVASLADALNVSHQAIYNARNKGKIPRSWFIDVGLATGVSVDWLLTGEGPIRSQILGAPAGRWPGALKEAASGTYPRPPADPAPEGDADLVLVPMVQARLAAGTGSFETSDEVEGLYAFRSSFLSRRGSPARMVMMRVAGDSMAPMIENGDVVLIDQGQDQPRPGQVFAVGIEDLVYLKMVDTLPGKLILRSANPLYQPIEIDTRGDLANGVHIIGHVIWVGRELR